MVLLLYFMVAIQLQPSFSAMLVLSSYRLSEENNARIAAKIEELGGKFVPTTFEQDTDSVIQQIEDCISDATIFLGGRLTQEQWEMAKQLQWINVPWAGVNSLLGLKGLRERDILITNSSGVMADSVADQVMAYLVMLNRNLPKQIRWQVRHEWNRYTTVEHPDRRVLRDMTLGILGYGAIGRAIALRARAFGMKVVAARRKPLDVPSELDAMYSPDNLSDLFAQSDFVVVALPLTPETERLIGAQELGYMKSTACIVNIARGKILVQDALIEALQQGRIGGAALDVFEEEPLPKDSPLWDMENVILTPHSCGGFVGFGNAVTHLFVENLDRVSRNLLPVNCVDVSRGY